MCKGRCACKRRCVSTLTRPFDLIPTPFFLRIETVPLAEWRTALDRMEAGGAKKQVLELE